MLLWPPGTPTQPRRSCLSELVTPVRRWRSRTTSPTWWAATASTEWPPSACWEEREWACSFLSAPRGVTSSDPTPLCVSVCVSVCRWVVYQEPNYRGPHYILEKRDYNNFSDWGSQNSTVGSMRRVRFNWAPPSAPPSSSSSSSWCCEHDLHASWPPSALHTIKLILVINLQKTNVLCLDSLFKSVWIVEILDNYQIYLRAVHRVTVQRESVCWSSVSRRSAQIVHGVVLELPRDTWQDTWYDTWQEDTW